MLCKLQVGKAEKTLLGKRREGWTGKLPRLEWLEWGWGGGSRGPAPTSFSCRLPAGNAARRRSAVPEPGNPAGRLRKSPQDTSVGEVQLWRPWSMTGLLLGPAAHTPLQSRRLLSPLSTGLLCALRCCCPKLAQYAAFAGDPLHWECRGRPPPSIVASSFSTLAAQKACGQVQSLLLSSKIQ